MTPISHSYDSISAALADLGPVRLGPADAGYEVCITARAALIRPPALS